jgi:hypothetical protein
MLVLPSAKATLVKLLSTKNVQKCVADVLLNVTVWNETHTTDIIHQTFGLSAKLNMFCTSLKRYSLSQISLAAILSLEALSNFLYSSIYFVSNLSDLLNRFAFWVFNSPIYYVIYEKHWTFSALYAAHVY